MPSERELWTKFVREREQRKRAKELRGKKDELSDEDKLDAYLMQGDNVDRTPFEPGDYDDVG